jgi:hypothetical protein
MREPSPPRTRWTIHPDTVVWIIISLALLVMSLLPGCGPVRSAIVAPHHAGACDPGPPDASLPTLCRGAVPYVCSRQGHLWPATPSGAPCPWGCFTVDGGAACGGPDASLDAGGEP